MPFSIWHWVAMMGANISYIGKADHSLGDLLAGVLICSETRLGMQTGMACGDLSRAVIDWSRKLSGGSMGALKRSIKRLRGITVTPQEIIGFSIQEQSEAFEFYLDSFAARGSAINDWSYPVTRSKIDQKSGVFEVNTPEPLLLLNKLTATIGISEAAAMDMSLPEARWNCAIHAERSGQVGIVNMDEARLDQKLANAFAKDGTPWDKVVL